MYAELFNCLLRSPFLDPDLLSLFDDILLRSRCGDKLPELASFMKFKGYRSAVLPFPKPGLMLLL